MSEKKKILFVDDEPKILEGLRRILYKYSQEWEMSFINSVELAISLMDMTDFDAIISDVTMPDKDGFELLCSIRKKEKTKDIPVVILTGLNTQGIKKRALEMGATDLLNKPVDPDELIARINNMLNLKSYQDKIKTQNALLEKKVMERTAELEAARLDLIWRLGKAAEFRDTDTGNHVLRVGYFCRVIAEALGMDKKFVDIIFRTSPLHDIGKIGIPDNILLKTDKLSSSEWKEMQSHCEKGKEILRDDVLAWKNFFSFIGQSPFQDFGRSDNPLLKIAATIALNHHERWDGKGYPKGLKGKEIPIEAQLTAVSDVYDALCSKRPYKPSLPEEKVLSIMREENGKHFNPDIFAAFEKSIDKIRQIRIQFADHEKNKPSVYKKEIAQVVV